MNPDPNNRQQRSTTVNNRQRLLSPAYLTDADRLRVCSHWLRRIHNLMHEGVDPAAAPHAAAREMKLGESLLRGWTLRLMRQALAQGQVSARCNALKAGVLSPNP